jgi:hypothetical protein
LSGLQQHPGQVHELVEQVHTLLLLLLLLLLLQVVIGDCNSNRANMRFEYLADGSLRWPGTNRCLDVRSSGTGEG